MKKTDIKTTTYEYKDGFYIDVVEGYEKHGAIEVYLYHKDYGIKELMFGVMPKDFSLELIENNLVNESYIEDYMDSYFD